MTVSREGYDKEIVFHCDGKRCAEIVETESTDFKHALAVVRDEGWLYEKEGQGFKHYCSCCKNEVMR